MKFAYVRVSVAEPSEDLQREALKTYGIEKWYIEKTSEKNASQPKLQKLLKFAREGDTIYVCDFSRLARNTADLFNVVEHLKEKKVRLVSKKEGLDSSTPQGELMVTMIGTIADFEKNNYVERRKIGIAIAKQNGAYVGRQPAKIPVDLFESEYAAYMSGKTTKGEFARNINVTRPTLEKLLNAYRDQTICVKNGLYYVDPKKK